MARAAMVVCLFDTLEETGQVIDAFPYVFHLYVVQMVVLHRWSQCVQNKPKARQPEIFKLWHAVKYGLNSTSLESAR